LFLIARRRQPGKSGEQGNQLRRDECSDLRQTSTREGTNGVAMCRNIHVLFNFEPPATQEEVRAAALQYVRKVSGYAKPSAANTAAFDQAVDDVAAATSALLSALVTGAHPRNREAEIAAAKVRAAQRFGTGGVL